MHAYGRSTQTVVALKGEKLLTLDLPNPGQHVGLGGPLWGVADVPLTPAYWAAQAWMWEVDAPDHFRLGRSLAEELLACILGGHGIPAEVGLAAYGRLRATLHSDPATLAEPERVEQLLCEPLSVRGRSVRYRFARQKAAYVAAAFRELPKIDETLCDRALRDRLIRIRGVGPKTASWVVRNWRASDDVAILDIHILRAGALLQIFDPACKVERHYPLLEQAFLEFARDLGVRASILDSVMWMTMRELQAVGARSPKHEGRPKISPPVVARSLVLV